MKKIFTLLAALFVISTVWAQETDNTFQFTDLEGNPVADGTVIVPEVLRPYMGCDVITKREK